MRQRGFSHKVSLSNLIRNQTSQFQAAAGGGASLKQPKKRSCKRGGGGGGVQGSAFQSEYFTAIQDEEGK